MRIESKNAKYDTLKDFSHVVQLTTSGVLEKVTWLLLDLLGRNKFSTSVFPTVVLGSHFMF